MTHITWQDQQNAAQQFLRNHLTTREHITVDVLTTEQLLAQTPEQHDRLCQEIEILIQQAFPQMPPELRATRLGEFFKRPGSDCHRYGMFLRNPSEELCAATLFDYGEIYDEDLVLQGVYVISCLVLPHYQGHGIGKAMAASVFVVWQPDVLLITCSQSTSLHSWVDLPQKGAITGYEVYPRLDQAERLVPLRDLEKVVSVFTQMFRRVVDNKEDMVTRALQNLTVFLVRRNMYAALYDFDPWYKKDREDRLAQALGATAQDGILVIFRKT